MQVLRQLHNDLKEYYKCDNDINIIKIEDIYNNVTSVVISLNNYNIKVYSEYQRFKVNEKVFINKCLLNAEKYIIINILNERRRERTMNNLLRDYLEGTTDNETIDNIINGGSQGYWYGGCGWDIVDEEDSEGQEENIHYDDMFKLNDGEVLLIGGAI